MFSFSEALSSAERNEAVLGFEMKSSKLKRGIVKSLIRAKKSCESFVLWEKEMWSAVPCEIWLNREVSWLNSGISLMSSRLCGFYKSWMKIRPFVDSCWLRIMDSMNPVPIAVIMPSRPSPQDLTLLKPMEISSGNLLASLMLEIFAIL